MKNLYKLNKNKRFLSMLILGFLMVLFTTGCPLLENLDIPTEEEDTTSTLPDGVEDSNCTPVISIDDNTKHYAREIECDQDISIYVENKTGSTDDFDVYLVYSNVGSSDQTLPDGSGNGTAVEGNIMLNINSDPIHPPIPDGVTEFNNDPTKRPPFIKGEYTGPNLNMGSVTVGSTTRNWYYENSANTVATTLAAYATTYAGNKVYIWQNGATLTTSYSGTKDNGDIGAIMTKFNGCNEVKGGSCTTSQYNSSIYKLVRGIAGEEWGSQPYNNLIPSTETDVHIVYFDIDGNGAWGVLGFFWAANNYTQSSFAYSNEALVFFMDSPTYKYSADAAIKLNGTLAHEFQHMIHFYQRSIKRGVNSPTWMNEMASMTVEDLVAQSITGTTGNGPAFGSNSRLARYVQYPNCNLTIWNRDDNGACQSWQDSYATAYSFGGFMARQYDGFIQNILTSTVNDFDAVQDAITRSGSSDTWQTAFRRWGGTFAMDDTTAGVTTNYPTGYGYTTNGNLQEVVVWGDSGTAPDATLSKNPTIYTSLPSTIRAYSNVIYRSAQNQSINDNEALEKKDITLPENVKLTVVVTPK